jgi:D-amino-acid dehydrogenase
MKDILIAGGGAIGLTTAYYLSKAGHRVTVIDQYDFLTNCSLGNAGLIVPSHFIPLASPGIIWQGIKWALDAKSPFSVNPKINKDLITWGYHFWKSASKQNVNKAAPILWEINSFSKMLYKEFIAKELDIEYQERGLLMVYRSEKTAHEEEKLADMALSLGIDAEVLCPNQLKKLEPNVDLDVTGGVFYPDDASISPEKYINSLIAYLKNNDNVTLLPNRTLQDVVVSNNKASKAITNAGDIEFDELVVASGVYSQKILQRLGLNVKVQAGKGYSFVKPMDNPLKTPLILVEARVAITPYTNFTRFAGAMEIGGDAHVIKEKKIQGITEAIRRYLPSYNFEQPKNAEVWSGLRPCSIDGLPYIGRTQKHKNIIVATGHSMMGISLAPATGKLIEELVSEKPMSLNIAPFNPHR